MAPFNVQDREAGRWAYHHALRLDHLPPSVMRSRLIEGAATELDGDSSLAARVVDRMVVSGDPREGDAHRDARSWRVMSEIARLRGFAIEQADGRRGEAVSALAHHWVVECGELVGEGVSTERVLAAALARLA